MAQSFRTAYSSFALDSGPSRATPVDPDFVQLRPPPPRVGKQLRTRVGALAMVDIGTIALSGSLLLMSSVLIRLGSTGY